MRTWFKRDIGRRPVRGVSGLGQSLCLTMGASSGLSPAATDNPTVTHNHAPDSRVGPTRALPALP